MNAGTREVSADSHETPLVLALDRGRCRMYPVLLRAGAALPSVTSDDAYIQRVVAAGGWANYERLHLDKLTVMLTPTPTPWTRTRGAPEHKMRHWH